MHVDFFSDILEKCVNMDVILPQNAAHQIGVEINAGVTFPVLYLLHGMSDDHTFWQRQTSIERYADRYGIAVIMPTTDLCWYTDMDCGYQNYYTFITKELPALCHGFFNGLSRKREETWIAGLSMGGYGALKIALNESNVFGKVAGLSGAYDICKYPDDPYWVSIWGKKENRGPHTIPSAVNKLIAEERPKPEIYLCCGTEDHLLDSSRNTRKLLEDNGFSVTYKESSGSHCWEYWDAEIQPILDWFVK